MKICFLSFYSGIHDRGVETFVTALASRLSKNHEVTVIQAGSQKPKQYYQQITIPAKIKNLEVNPLGLARKLRLDYYSRRIGWFSFKALKYLKLNKPDIIVATNGGWQTFLTKLYSLTKKSKIVISGQAGMGWDEKWNLHLKPNLYVALAQVNADWVTKNFPRQKLSAIHNGVDVKRFSQKMKGVGKEFTLIKKLSKPIILCVAGHEKYKRVTDTIQAVAKLKSGSLLVLGGSEETQSLGQKVLGARFLQTKVKHELMPAVYQAADLFTLTSESYEGFGIAYLEAMAAGLPVVATDDSLRHEIVGKAGSYVKNPSNHLAYAQKLQQTLDKDWHNLPQKQATKFDWDLIAREYEKAFIKLLTN